MHAVFFIIVLLATYMGIKAYLHSRTARMIDILNIDICDLMGAGDDKKFMELAHECYEREVKLAKWRFLRHLKESDNPEPIIRKAEMILGDPNCSWDVFRVRRLMIGDKSISYVTKKGDITIRVPKDQCAGSQNRTVDETLSLRNIPPKYLDDFWNLTYSNLFPGEY